MIIKALDSGHNYFFQVTSLNFKFLFCQSVMIEKLPILGINVNFVDCSLFAQSMAMFTHSALRQLSLQIWCQQGAVSEFFYLGHVPFYSFDQNVMLRPTD